MHTNVTLDACPYPGVVAEVSAHARLCTGGPVVLVLPEEQYRHLSGATTTRKRAVWNWRSTLQGRMWASASDAGCGTLN